MLLHNWVFYITLFITFHTAYTLLFRKISKEYPHHYRLVISIIFIFLWLSGLVYVLLTKAISFKNILPALPFLLIGGFIFSYANVYGSKAMGRIDAAQHTILSTLRVIVTVIGSSLLLREGLNTAQIVGAILLLTSGVLSSFKITRRSFTIDRNSLFATFSAFLTGIAITNEKHILSFMNIQTYLIVGWGLQTISLLIVSIKDMKNIKVLVREKIFSKLVGAGILRGLSGVAFVSSLVYSNNSSLASVASSFIVISVVITAAILLKERDHLLRKVAASILAVVGLIIILY